MSIEYKKAKIEDAELFIKIYDAVFYSDYIRYGEPVGGISCKEIEHKKNKEMRCYMEKICIISLFLISR